MHQDSAKLTTLKLGGKDIDEFIQEFKQKYLEKMLKRERDDESEDSSRGAGTVKKIKKEIGIRFEGEDEPDVNNDTVRPENVLRMVDSSLVDTPEKNYSPSQRSNNNTSADPVTGKQLLDYTPVKFRDQFSRRGGAQGFSGGGGNRSAKRDNDHYRNMSYDEEKRFQRPQMHDQLPYPMNASSSSSNYRRGGVPGYPSRESVPLDDNSYRGRVMFPPPPAPSRNDPRFASPDRYSRRGIGGVPTGPVASIPFPAGPNMQPLPDDYRSSRTSSNDSGFIPNSGPYVTGNRVQERMGSLHRPGSSSSASYSGPSASNPLGAYYDDYSREYMSASSQGFYPETQMMPNARYDYGNENNNMPEGRREYDEYRSQRQRPGSAFDNRRRY